jgi:hypothetical protein
MEYNISNITITIKPWVCNYCTIINTSHPYFCNVCNNQNDIYSVLPEAEDYKQLNKIDRVKNVFGKTTKILLPVLSCYTENQFLDNIDKLYTYFKQKKISGIFLLSTNINIQNFEIMYENAKKIYPDFWMGINLIGFNIFNVFDFIKKYNPDGLWVDNSYLCNINNLGLCELIINQFKKNNWKGLYFGGVMFKYTSTCNYYNDEIIKITNKYMDILTTTGDGTGIEITNDKLEFIHNNTNDVCIAIASGIHNNNINKISEKANVFIVRTSIVDNTNNIDLDKLNDLIYSLYTT